MRGSEVARHKRLLSGQAPGLLLGLKISDRKQDIAMDEPSLPRSPKLLASRPRKLRAARRQRHIASRRAPTRQGHLTKDERAVVLDKTAGRCHMCSGKVVVDWEADHVLAHSSGGPHRADNYLPAHTLCNNYRWDYLPEEFRWVLKIGVWARKQMETSSGLGLRRRPNGVQTVPGLATGARSRSAAGGKRGHSRPRIARAAVARG